MPSIAWWPRDDASEGGEEAVAKMAVTYLSNVQTSTTAAAAPRSSELSQR